jgi:hypothetical protein
MILVNNLEVKGGIFLGMEIILVETQRLNLSFKRTLQRDLLIVHGGMLRLGAVQVLNTMIESIKITSQMVSIHLGGHGIPCGNLVFYPLHQ